MSTVFDPPERTMTRPHPKSGMGEQEYLHALVASSHALNASTDQFEVGQVLVKHTAELLPISAVIVQLLDDHNWLHVIAAQGASPEFLALHTGPVGECIGGKVFREDRVFATWDLRSVSDSRLATSASAEGIVAVACAPMIFAGKPVGILSVFCHEPYHFSATEFDVLSLLAAQGGIALTNAGSIRALKTQSQDMRMSFHRVGEALSASLDMGETLHLIVQLGLDMTHADAGAVYMRQSEFVGGGMRLAGMQGLDRRSMRRFRGGGISPIAKRAIAEGTAIVVPDTRRVPEAAFPTLRSANGDVAETRSLICIPLISGENVWGVLEQYSTQVGNFQQNEINLLTTFALQATGAIERAQIYAQECHLAETLQRAFLPELPQSIHGFQIGRIYAPGNTEVSVGGDTYDLFTLPDGRVALVIADVTGNGTTAATLSVMVKYTLRAYALENPEPSAVMGRLNKAVLNQTDDATFVSAIFGLIDPQTQKVLLTNAGHPDPLLYRASLKTCSPRSGVTGVLAGCLPDQKYTSYTIEPVTDDVLVFYTDGVVEARHGREQFGVERLAEMVKQNAHLNAQELAATIYSSVTEFAAGERADDFALLVLKAE